MSERERERERERLQRVGERRHCSSAVNSLVSWFTNTNVICAQTKTPKDVQLWPSFVAPGMAGGKKERKAGALLSGLAVLLIQKRERELTGKYGTIHLLASR